MQVKFKAIMCAAAAVLSVGIASSAVAADAPLALDKEAAYEAAYGAAVTLREDPEWIEAFQLALLEGKSPIDPVHAAFWGIDMNEENDEIMPAYFEQAAPASTDATKIELTLVHDDQGGTGYNLWSGRFVVDDVYSFANKFTDPYTMDCEIRSGTFGRLTYKRDLSVNYKKLIGQYYYMEGGKKVGDHDTSEGTGTISDVVSTYSGSGNLIEKAFYFYLYRGGSKSEYYDVVVIHVVDKEYAGTEEYAALPYGSLIGSYTYVDVNELSEVVFEEN